MPDLWAGILATEGLPWIIAAAFVASMVRGFSGFGTAMVYLPVAGQFLPPVWALVTLTVMDLVGPLPVLPKVWKDVHKRDLGRMFLGVVVTLPIGVAVLLAIDPQIFRYAVSFVALALLVVLVGGFRYSGTVRGSAVVGIGGASGFLGGVAGLPGPPVILFYMASPHGPATIRANTMVFLLGFDVLLLGILGLEGSLTLTPIALGLVLIVPTMLGVLVGGAIFRPEYEKSYRAVAYVIIAVSAISGLPFWS